MPDFAALIDTVWSRCCEGIVENVVEPASPAQLSPATDAFSYGDGISSSGTSSMASNEDSDEKNPVKLYGVVVVLGVAQQGRLAELCRVVFQDAYVSV